MKFRYTIDIHSDWQKSLIKQCSTLFLTVIILFACAPISSAQEPSCSAAEMKQDVQKPKLRKNLFLRDYKNFAEAVTVNFKLGDPVCPMISWLKAHDFEGPHLTPFISLTKTLRRQEAGATEDMSALRQLYKSIRTICGRTNYKVVWRTDKMGNIAELYLDEERCYLQAP